MKLTEAILLESFSDLKRIMRDSFIEVAGDTRISGSNVATLKKNDPTVYSTYNQLVSTIKNAQQQGVDVPRVQLNTADGVFEVLKWIMKHPYITNNWRSTTDTGRWIKMLRNPVAGLKMVMMTMDQLIPKIVTYETDPNRQKPDLQTIKTTPKYEVYKLNNYMAARKVCNTFNTNFCIGADPGWFDRYGDSQGRDTYAITLPNKTVVIVHAGDGGFLITDHANRADVSDSGAGRGKAGVGIADDFKAANLSREEAVAALKLTIPSRFHSNVEEIMRDGFRSESSPKLIYRDNNMKVEDFQHRTPPSIKVTGRSGEIYIGIKGEDVVISDDETLGFTLKMSPMRLRSYLTNTIGLSDRHLAILVDELDHDDDVVSRWVSETIRDSMRFMD